MEATVEHAVPEQGKHVFERLVPVRDWLDGSNKAELEAAGVPVADIEGYLDYAWDDEMRHYSEGLADEDLEGLSDDEVLDHARGYTAKAICDTHGSFDEAKPERMVRVNEIHIYTCRECDEEGE